MDAMSEIRSIYPLIRDRFKVHRIGLFGSYSSGTERPDSDIDLIVEFDETSFDNYMGLYLFLGDRFGKKVDLVTPNALNERLKNSILKQVVWVAS
jgi:hypothetical protein